MNVVKTDIPDVLIFEPKIFCDDRGFFFESFNQKVFEEAVGYDVHFVQDNHSKSSKNVLRGLHYQTPPYAQAKLVRCIRGKYTMLRSILEKLPKLMVSGLVLFFQRKTNVNYGFLKASLMVS